MCSRINVIYPPSLLWDETRQRPHHLLRELAKNGMHCYFCDADRKTQTPFRQIEERFYYSPGISDCIKDIKEKGGFNIYYAQYPGAMKYITNFPVNLLWYDYLDDFPQHRREEAEIIRKAPVVTASGIFLQNKAVKLRGRQDVHYIGNGCDFEHFSRAGSPLPCPPLDGIDRPVIGYIGAIANWMDLKLLHYLVKSFDFAKIVLVGGLFHNITLPRSVNDNLLHLGVKPYQELPQYLSRFDVCIIPFDTKKDLIRAVNPLKLYEYFSAGKPVVSTSWDEIRRFEPMVKTENDPYRFAVAVRESLNENDLSLKEERKRIAGENNWGNIGNNLFTILKSEAEKRSGISIKMEYGELAENKREPAKPLIRQRGKKVCIVAPYFLHPEGEEELRYYGGAERYYLNLADILQEEFGCEVHSYQIGNEDKIGSFRGITGFFVDEKNYIQNLNDLLLKNKRNGITYNLHIYSPLRLATDPPSPSIGLYHGIDFDTGLRSKPADTVKKEISLFAITKLSLCVGVDYNFTSITKSFFKTDLEKWEVIPNFCDTQRFFPGEKRSRDEINILYPRFIYLARGYDIALRCAEYLTQKYKTVRFTFCGNGYPDTLKEVKDLCDRNSSVRYTVKNFDEMPEVFRQADITIIPTHFAEGTSLSALEAMGSGNIVVTSWIGGLPAVVTDNFSGFICPDRAEDFIGKLEFIIENMDSPYITSIRQNAVNTVQQAFSFELWKERWIKIFERFL